MATGDRKANIFVNRLLSKTALREQLMEYLSGKIDDTIAAFFQGGQGTLDKDKIGLAADGANRFKLDLSLANTVGVATGQFIVIPDETDVSKYVKFENALGVTYYVGVRYNEVEWNDIGINPRYGNPEYPSIMDSLGELGSPQAVVDTSGVKIRLQLDNLFESGVDHSGRNVKVWMTVPVSGVQGTAFYEGVSYYSGGHNYLDIPYAGSNGPLGQDTASGPPSTTTGDYKCFVKGVTWRRNTDLSLDPTYAFIGTVQGAGAGNPPTVFDIDGQTLLYLITLDRAYDGPSTVPGFGRAIQVDAGAVELNTGTGDEGDIGFAQLRLNRLNNTDRAQFMLQMITGDISEVPLAILQPMQWAEMTFDEPVTLSGARCTFTRVGAQPNAANLRINGKQHVLWLTDSSNPANDGLYGISAVGATYVDCVNLRTGAAVSWSGSATANILVPRVVFGDEAPFHTVLSDWEGFTFILRNGNNGNTPIKLFAEQADGELFELHGDYEAPFLPDKRIKIVNEYQGAGPVYSPVLQIGEHRTSPANIVAPAGLRLYPTPDLNADKTAINIHSKMGETGANLPFHRYLGWHNDEDEEMLRLGAWGDIMRPPVFEEDFFWPSNIPGYFFVIFGGGGAINWSGSGSGLNARTQGGSILLSSNPVSGNGIRWLSSYLGHFEHPISGAGKIVYCSGRLRIIDSLDTMLQMGCRCGMMTSSGAYNALVYEATGSTSQWKFQSSYDNGVTVNETIGKGAPTPGYTSNELGWVQFWMRAKHDWSYVYCILETDSSIDVMNFNNPSHTNWDDPLALFCDVWTNEAVTKYVELDYMAWWTSEVRAGPKDRNS